MWQVSYRVVDIQQVTFKCLLTSVKAYSPKLDYEL